MKRIWINGSEYQYEDLNEIQTALRNNDVSLGNYVRLGDYVSLGNGVRLGDGVSLGKSPLYINSDLPFIFNGYNNRIQIGCRDYTVDYWLENYKQVAIEVGITDEQIIEKYYQLIKLYSTWKGVVK